MLPQLSYAATGQTEDDGIFFRTSDELKRVLVQGNPVYLVLELPWLLTSIIVCFPVPRAIRVYGKTSSQGVLLGETTADDRPVPENVQYRYGMRLSPWMFVQALPKEVPPHQDHLVNYVITNCDFGFSGALLRVFRSCDGRRKNDEWLEVRQFDTANEYLFGQGKWKDDNLNNRSIVRFIKGLDSERFQSWKPERGWDAYPQQSIPVETDY